MVEVMIFGGYYRFICFDYLFNFDVGDVNFFGKFSYGFVGVFVGERVDVDFYVWGYWGIRLRSLYV